MLEMKPISRAAIPEALQKADRYRLLNQPRQAESICRDILRADPDRQEALVMLLLCLTDQFGRPGLHAGIKEAREILARLRGEYDRVYYDGVLCERWGKSQLAGSRPARVAADWLREAMRLFESAQPLSPPGNEEAILHWNACARLINRIEESGDVSAEESEAAFRDDAPL